MYYKVRFVCFVLMFFFISTFSGFSEAEVENSEVSNTTSSKESSETPDEGSKEANKDSKSIRLSPVVVTATRVEQSIKDIPQSSTVITEEECETPLVKNAGDILRQSSDIRVDSFGGYGSLTTTSIRGTNANQSLYMIDGRPVNDINNGLLDFSKIPVENIERIEVIRGPGSSLYGANAFGGVINIITKMPVSDAPTVRTKTSFGGYDTFYQSAAHGWNLGKFGYYVSGNYVTTSGYRDNSDYRGYNIAAQAFFEPIDTVRLDYAFMYHQDNMGIPGARPQSGTLAQFGSEEITSYVDRNRNRNFYSSIKLSWDAHERIKVKGRFYYDFQKLRSFLRYRGMDPNTFATIIVDNDNLFDTYAIGTDYQIDAQLFEGNVLSAGTDIRREQLRGWSAEYNHYTGDIASNTSWKPHVIKRGVWIQDQWQVLENVRIQGALRYDWHTNFHSNWSPSAGLVVDLTKTTQLKISGGKSFRAPTFNDLFWPNSGNPELMPEKGWTGEWAIDQQLWENRINLHAGIVAWHIKDKIQWFPNAMGDWEPQNMNSQKLFGLEFSADAQPLDDLNIYVGWNYYKSKQINREIIFSNGVVTRSDNFWRQAAYIPVHQVSFGASYVFPWKTKVDLTGRFRSNSVNYYSDWSMWPNVGMLCKNLDKFVNIDLTVSQKLHKNSTMYILIKNLTGEAASESFGGSFLDRDYPVMPVSVEAGLQIDI